MNGRSRISLSSVPWKWARFFALCSALVALCTMFACGSPGSDGSDPGSADLAEPPCSCTEGSRRCVGTSVQVCERASATCSSWGPEVSCPTGMCNSGSCGGSCVDDCAAGSARCAADGQREVCRLAATGCLAFVPDACAGGQYCFNDQCVDSVPCASGCPMGYSCQRNGVCSGGLPTSVVLNVQTVQFGGSVTLNGVTPTPDATVCSTTKNPTWSKAVVHLVETSKGYQFDLAVNDCTQSTFNFSGKIFPGTYRVSVKGYYDNAVTGKPLSNLPTTDYIVVDRLLIP